MQTLRTIITNIFFCSINCGDMFVKEKNFFVYSTDNQFCKYNIFIKDISPLRT